MRSLEQKGASFSFKPLSLSEAELAELIEKTKVATTQRIYQVQQASAGRCYRGAAARGYQD